VLRDVQVRFGAKNAVQIFSGCVELRLEVLLSVFAAQ
jgi:hypothetical protein